MTREQRKQALFEQYQRFKERAEQSLQRYRQGQETFETASLAVLDFGKFTLEVTKEMLGDR